MFPNHRLPVPPLPATQAPEMSDTGSAMVERPPVGARLKHATYGFGRVVHHVGTGDVGISFERYGYKLFVWQFAHANFATAPPAR